MLFFLLVDCVINVLCFFSHTYTHVLFSAVFLFNYYFKYKFDVNGKWKYEYLNFGSIRSGFVFIEYFSHCVFGWEVSLSGVYRERMIFVQKFVIDHKKLDITRIFGNVSYKYSTCLNKLFVVVWDGKKSHTTDEKSRNGTWLKCTIQKDWLPKEFLNGLKPSPPSFDSVDTHTHRYTEENTTKDTKILTYIVPLTYTCLPLFQVENPSSVRKDTRIGYKIH